MSTYTVTSEQEQGVEVWFALRDGQAVSRHQNAETAWNSAEAKAKAEAQRTGKQAIYTAVATNEARACWLVRP